MLFSFLQNHDGDFLKIHCLKWRYLLSEELLYIREVWTRVVSASQNSGLASQFYKNRNFFGKYNDFRKKDIIFVVSNATLAQLVEQLIRNEQVEGSNPLSGSGESRTRPAPSEFPQGRKAARAGGCSGAMCQAFPFFVPVSQGICQNFAFLFAISNINLLFREKYLHWY